MKSVLLFLMFAAQASFAAAGPTYVSLKTPFANFLAKGKDADFETRLDLWKSEVESKLPDVFADLLKASGAPVDQKRRALAEKWFGFYFANAEKILAQFDQFETLGYPIVKRLVNTYSDVDFSDVRIVAMPSLMMFNGQVRAVGGRPVAMFGMDFLELIRQNPKLIEGLDLMDDMRVLVSHEFTHALHSKLSNFENSADIPGMELFSSLWLEGMAEVSSQMLVPGTDLTTVLMERNLAAKCSRDQTVVWAGSFLQDMKADRFDFQKAYSKWFMVNGIQQMGVARAGYCLGYHAVLLAMQDHSFVELLKMKKLEVSKLLATIVKRISESN